MGQQLTCGPIVMLAAGSSMNYTVSLAVNSTGGFHINVSADCSRDSNNTNNNASSLVSVQKTCAQYSSNGTPFWCANNFQFNASAAAELAPSQATCCMVRGASDLVNWQFSCRLLCGLLYAALPVATSLEASVCVPAVPSLCCKLTSASIACSFFQAVGFSGRMARPTRAQQDMNQTTWRQTTPAPAQQLVAKVGCKLQPCSCIWQKGEE
jgi:hypothetical protein